MELISKAQVSDASGFIEILKTPERNCLVAEEDVFAFSETVTCENGSIIIDKDTVVKQNLVIRERIVIPNEQSAPNMCSSSVFSVANDELKAPQNSQNSLMELGSQESNGSLKMEICSQESLVSSMELGSQEINQDSNNDIDKNVTDACRSGYLNEILPNKTVATHNNLKRKLVIPKSDDESPKKLCTEDTKPQENIDIGTNSSGGKGII